MDHMTQVEMIRKARLVAILRGIPADMALPVAQALYDGGIRALEFTFDHSDPDCIRHNCEMVKRVRGAFGSELLVGCGTVLTTEEVREGVAAGAELMISPNTDPTVIRCARELGAVSMPGAMTPSEIVTAYEAGADFVKLFPAGELGTGYIRAVRGPLRHIPLVAVGGVRPDTIPGFLDAGICGFGAGGELVQKNLIAANDMAGLSARATEFIRAIRTWEASRA